MLLDADAGGGAPRSSAHMCEKAPWAIDVEKAFVKSTAASENSNGDRTAADSASATVSDGTEKGVGLTSLLEAAALEALASGNWEACGN